MTTKKIIYFIIGVNCLIYTIETITNTKNVLKANSDSALTYLGLLSHGNIMHLAFNMLALLEIAKTEYHEQIKPKELIFLTIISYLIGVFVGLMFYPEGSVGYSGILFSYFGFLAVDDFVRRKNNSFAIAAVIVSGGFDIIGLFMNTQLVAHYSHLFGSLTGVIFYIMVNYDKVKQAIVHKLSDLKNSNHG